MNQTHSSRLGASQIEIPNLTISDSVLDGSVESDFPALQVWTEADGEVTAYCHELDGNFWIRWVGVAGYCFDRESKTVTAFPEPNLDAFFIQDTYRRSILPIIQHLLGKESLHASAVLTSEGVVGLCGASRSGKSTIACGLSHRGYSLWSDDALVLEISGSSPQAIPFPFRLHLRPSSATFFGLDPAEFTGRSARLEAYKSQTGNETLSTLFILDLRSDLASGSKSAVVRLSPQEALTGLLPHAHCFSLKNEDRKRQMMQNFMALANRVPVFVVQFERKLERLQETLDQIEHALRSSQTA